jgi:hypothetical protein
VAHAHSPNPEGDWHDLVPHLRGTSKLASEFASAFGAAEAARIVGMYHDLGKFHPAFSSISRTVLATRLGEGTDQTTKRQGACSRGSVSGRSRS